MAKIIEEVVFTEKTRKLLRFCVNLCSVKHVEIIYRMGDKEVGRVDIVTANGAEKMGFAEMFIEMFRKCA